MARNIHDLMLAMEVLWNNNQQFSENPPVALKQFKYKGGKLNIAYSPTLDGLSLDADYQDVYKSINQNTN